MNMPLNQSNVSSGRSDFLIAKIVSNTSETSWSQAYNAGGLFAVLSLQKEAAEETTESESLSLIGKKILDALEQNFFIIENKDLESIKQAVLESAKVIPQNIESSFVIAAFVKNILYLFANDQGKVFIKRGNRFGTILDPNELDSKSIVSSSGFVENYDFIVLGTKSFFNIIDSQTLAASLDNRNPAEIAESLTPQIHEKEESRAAAIFLQYEKIEEPNLSFAEERVLEETEIPDESPKSKSAFIGNLIAAIKQKVRLPVRKPNFRINHSKKIYLTVAVIVFIVFISSVILAAKKQNAAKTKAMFENIYNNAQKSYSEGLGLLDLNKNLATDSFETAQKTLQDGESKFPKNSAEEKQILALLQKVNDDLAASSAVNSVNAHEVDATSSNILNAEINNPKARFFTQDNKNIYFADNNNVYSLSKSTSKITTIIKNDNLWQDIHGIGTYLGNIYLLSQNQILKFVPFSGSFTNSNYLSGNTAPDFSQASSMTIDGAIYVLLNDGSIEKFLRGSTESFMVSGLDKPFSSPSRILTDTSFNDIYVLDNGNSRIVVLDKNGAYVSQYESGILKNARDFDVLENSGKIFVLSQNKIYEIDMK